MVLNEVEFAFDLLDSLIKVSGRVFKSDHSLASLLEREEHGPQLGEPAAVDGGDGVHVLLGRHHQLVVHHVVGRRAQPEQRRRGVQVARHARPAVDVLADAFETGGLLEVRWREE